MTIDKGYRILQPKYYSRFQCDPEKCQETCCERWQIIIDKETYKKYIQSENPVIKEIVRAGLVLNEASSNEDDYAVVKLNSEMLCPFLNSKGLCEAYICLGEESLSKTCKSYPRAVVLMNDIIERGLEVSCSVAAELVLMNEIGIEFEYVNERISSNNLYITTPEAVTVQQFELVKEIRGSIIDILQNRRLGLDERVAAVGGFLKLAMESIEPVETALVKLKAVKADIPKGKLDIGLKKQVLPGRMQFDYLNTMLSMKFKDGDNIRFSSKNYIECLMQVLGSFGRVKAKELEKYYNTSYEQYLKPYLSRRSYILENFLVNYTFIYSLELLKLDDIWTWYMKLSAIYGLLKFNLIGLAAVNKGMKDEIALKLLQSFSKTIITDQTYLDSVVRYMEQEQLDELDKLLVIIFN